VRLADPATRPCVFRKPVSKELSWLPKKKDKKNGTDLLESGLCYVRALSHLYLFLVLEKACPLQGFLAEIYSGIVRRKKVTTEGIGECYGLDSAIFTVFPSYDVGTVVWSGITLVV